MSATISNINMRLGIFTLLVALILPGVSAAQVGLQPQNDIIITPTHPLPGQEFTATIDDYAGGLFGSQITWYYNGEVVPDSINQRSITLTAIDLGQQGIIEAVFLTPSGLEQSLTKVIRPVYVDLIIEPQTRVPGWYEGRALPSYGSQVNATVLVSDGTIIDPQTLIYTWNINNQVLEGGPVRGQHKTSFLTPRGGEMLVSVSVSSVTGATLATRAQAIPIVQPKLTFYERHSLYGLSHIPVASTLNLIGGGATTLQAEPFYLDTRVYNNPDIIEWQIDGIDINNGSSNPYQITVQPTGISRSSRVNLHVRSLETLLQGAEKSVTVSFN